MKSNKSKNKPFLLKGHLSSSSNLVLLLRVPGGAPKNVNRLISNPYTRLKRKNYSVLKHLLGKYSLLTLNTEVLLKNPFLKLILWIHGL